MNLSTPKIEPHHQPNSEKQFSEVPYCIGEKSSLNRDALFRAIFEKVPPPLCAGKFPISVAAE